MKIEKTGLRGVLQITPPVFKDSRGFFFESFQARKYKDGGIQETFVQDNHSRSVKNTLRGLHAQRAYPQGKLVRVLQGRIFDVAVDIKNTSPTYLKWTAADLSADNFKQMYVPPGYAHGFCVLSETAEVEYKCTDYYHPEDEISIRWDDPSIGITWPVSNPILSAKDAKAKLMSDLIFR